MTVYIQFRFVIVREEKFTFNKKMLRLCFPKLFSEIAEDENTANKNVRPKMVENPPINQWNQM